MLSHKRSIAETCPYDVWLEIFRYFSLSANLGLDEVFSPEEKTWPASSSYAIVPASARALMRLKSTLRLVSKEFNHLLSSVFYEVLIFTKWSYVTDLLALVASNTHVRETLSRSTKRIDLPYKGVIDDPASTAALLLSACPNVTHLTCAFLLSPGLEFLEQMRTMGFGPKLRYLHLTRCPVDYITPYLHYFSNLETVRISTILLEEGSSPSVPLESIHLPRLRTLHCPTESIYWKMKDQMLNAPMLPKDGGHRTLVNTYDLWVEHGHSLEELPPGWTFNFNFFKFCSNLRFLRVTRELFFDFDKGKSTSTSKVEGLVIVTDEDDDDYIWERGHNKQGRMDSLFKKLLALIEEGVFSNLKEFTVDIPYFRRHAWDVFPWASRVWHRRISAHGIQLFDGEGPLDYPTSDIFY